MAGVRMDRAGAENRVKQGQRFSTNHPREADRLELEKASVPMEAEKENMNQASRLAKGILPTEKVLYSETDAVPDDRLLNLFNKDEVLQSKRLYWIGRRTQDIVFSSIALLILWPLLLICALLIVIDSPGASPFFVQERIGRNGKPFRIFKLRTMVPHAEKMLDKLLDKNEMDGPAFKMKNDPRITRMGRFLRKACIDELPQLLNILKGDMSIVGPRPAIPREVQQYTAYQRQRLYVTPGLTCYWQIQPNRNDTSFDEWMELDLKYIRERSFLTDWKIILKTVGTVLHLTGE